MSDAHDPEPVLPPLANGHDGACVSPPGFQDAQPVVPFRGRVVRQLVGATARLDVRRGGEGQARGVQGWLRFRAWSCSSASPIGRASSWFSR
jgi:hypothetical protein